MKIKEFNITNYGPLSEVKAKLGEFNLFYGENERGKTLTIEAIIRFLLGSDIKDYPFIDRVKDFPSGYVIVEDDEYKNLKISQLKENEFQEFANLTGSECRNLFIIRNSDLAIKNSEEFYSQITEKLTGIQTRPISNIKKKFYEIGKVTKSPHFNFSDKAEDKKLKTRIQDASKLNRKIENFLIKCEETGKTELEIQLIKAKEELNFIDRELDQLFNAEKREKYEKGEKGLKKLTTILDELNKLSMITQDFNDRWNNNITLIDTLNQHKTELLKELINEKENLNKIVEENTIVEKKLTRMSNDAQIIEETQVLVDKYQSNNKNIKAEEKRFPAVLTAFLITGICLSISLIGTIFQPFFFSIFLVIFSICVVFTFVLMILYYHKKGNAVKLFEDIKLNIAKIGKVPENFEQVVYMVNNFNQEYSELRNQSDKQIWEKSSVEEKIEKIKGNSLPNLENQLENLNTDINNIKSLTETNNLNEFNDKLNKKSDLNTKYEKKTSTLEEICNTPEDLLIDEKLSLWRTNLSELAFYKEKAKNIKYDSKIEVELRNKHKNLKERYNKLESQLKSFLTQLRDFQSLSQTILIDEAEITTCENLADLSEINLNINNFVQHNEDRRECVKIAWDIFNDIEMEEKKKISEILEDPNLLHIFNQITRGRYSRIIYDANDTVNNLKVVLKSGKTLIPHQISSGTYDQLYFSIRLALSKKVLKNKLGFFILDDPFIKSDIIRLSEKLKILFNLSNEGWQILYFTAKKEVRDFFEENNLLEKINLFPMDSDLS